MNFYFLKIWFYGYFVCMFVYELWACLVPMRVDNDMRFPVISMIRHVDAGSGIVVL